MAAKFHAIAEVTAFACEDGTVHATFALAEAHAKAQALEEFHSEVRSALYHELCASDLTLDHGDVAIIVNRLLKLYDVVPKEQA